MKTLIRQTHVCSDLGTQTRTLTHTWHAHTHTHTHTQAKHKQREAPTSLFYLIFVAFKITVNYSCVGTQ